MYSTGRGGVGNLRSPSRDVSRPPAVPDVAEQEVVENYVATHQDAVVCVLPYIFGIKILLLFFSIPLGVAALATLTVPALVAPLPPLSILRAEVVLGISSQAQDWNRTSSTKQSEESTNTMSRDSSLFFFARLWTSS